jgi:hypothetical protein
MAEVPRVKGGFGGDVMMIGVFGRKGRFHILPLTVNVIIVMDLKEKQIGQEVK